MGYDKLKCMAVLAALATAPAWWLAAGESDAEAKPGPPAVAVKDGGAEAGAPVAPTIAGVFPPSGSPLAAGALQVITIQGDHFGTTADNVKVYYGSKGFPRECPLLAAPPAGAVGLLSDKLLRCKLASSPPLGEAQHFVVSVQTDGKAMLSDASTATFTLLEPAVASGYESHPTAPAPSYLEVQVHLHGANFSVEGGDPPAVSCLPPACTPAAACGNVLLISPSELFCTVPSAGHHAAPAAPVPFQITRAGE